MGGGWFFWSDFGWVVPEMGLSFVLGSDLGANGRKWKRKMVTTTMRSDRGGKSVTILDYGAGNVRSLENAVRRLGYDLKWVQEPEDITSAERLIFPGVGSFGAAMQNLKEKNFADALVQYLQADRPFLGICLGLHTLFESSEESPGVAGLGVLAGTVTKFMPTKGLSVPHMGWNTLQTRRPSALLEDIEDERFYFVHSFRVEDSEDGLAMTTHGSPFVAVAQRGNLLATQFHPEKSGAAGLKLIDNFISSPDLLFLPPKPATSSPARSQIPGLSKRIVACLDVRENDQGDLVVTKGDQYDVREKGDDRQVRSYFSPK